MCLNNRQHTKNHFFRRLLFCSQCFWHQLNFGMFTKPDNVEMHEKYALNITKECSFRWADLKLPHEPDERQLRKKTHIEHRSMEKNFVVGFSHMYVLRNFSRTTTTENYVYVQIYWSRNRSAVCLPIQYHEKYAWIIIDFSVSLSLFFRNSIDLIVLWSILQFLYAREIFRHSFFVLRNRHFTAVS